MNRFFASLICACVLTSAAVVDGQQPGPPGRGQPPPAPGAPQPAGRGAPPPAPAQPREPTTLPADAVNVRLQFTISDNYSGTAIRKTASMLVLNGEGGSIRTSTSLPPPRPSEGAIVPFEGAIVVPLNIDARVRAYPDGRIRAVVNVQYTPSPGGPGGNVRPANLQESLTVLLHDGKPIVVSESADPVTDRKVTVEITATVVK